MSKSRINLVWIPLGLRSSLIPGSSAVDCWKLLLSSIKNQPNGNELILLVGFLLWRIWKVRNAFVFESEAWDSTAAIQKALNHRDEVRAAINSNQQTKFGENKSVPGVFEPRWSPPPTGFVKINCDAAVDKNRTLGAVGIVIRNGCGQIQHVLCKTFPGISNPLILEGIAIREAMLLGVQKGVQFSIIESDSLCFIQALKRKCSPKECDVVARDIINLSNSFVICNFNYTRRSSNWVTHIVAKKALCNSSIVIDDPFLLDWLKGLLFVKPHM